MRPNTASTLLGLLLGCLLSASSWAQAPAEKKTAAAPTPAKTAVSATSRQYVLRPGDVVQMRVFQEDDLTAEARVGKDGGIELPLVGTVKVVGKDLEQCAKQVRDLLADGYLVNPQVTFNVKEFAKRRYTVLGQVQRPGTYDMPTDDAVSLLQAIATAGGYTRIGNPKKVTVQRTIGEDGKVYKIDAEAMASRKDEKPFEILPDDVIVVPEKWI